MPPSNKRTWRARRSFSLFLNSFSRSLSSLRFSFKLWKTVNRRSQRMKHGSKAERPGGLHSLKQRNKPDIDGKGRT